MTALELQNGLLDAWKTNELATSFLIRYLPPEIWELVIPGTQRKTVGSMCAHLHNARCMWVKMLGTGYKIKVPPLVNARKCGPEELLEALPISGTGIKSLISTAIENGKLKDAAWQNFQTDPFHILSYFVAHEAHHRGQLCLVARQLGHKLPKEVTSGLWHWKKLQRMGATD